MLSGIIIVHYCERQQLIQRINPTFSLLSGCFLTVFYPMFTRLSCKDILHVLEILRILMLVAFHWSIINTFKFISSMFNDDFAAYQNTNYLYVINRYKYNWTVLFLGTASHRYQIFQNSPFPNKRLELGRGHLDEITEVRSHLISRILLILLIPAIISLFSPITMSYRICIYKGMTNNEPVDKLKTFRAKFSDWK